MLNHKFRVHRLYLFKRIRTRLLSTICLLYLGLSLSPIALAKPSYESKMKALEQKVKQKEKHEKKINREWKSLQALSKKNTRKAQAKVEHFINHYHDHKLGNSKEQEAKALLTHIVESLKAENHKVEIKKQWLAVRKKMARGDAKARKELDLFVDQYNKNSLGNPYAHKAWSTYLRGRSKLFKKHYKSVKKQWDRLLKVIKFSGNTSKQMVDLFLEEYKSHELGHPFKDVAQAARRVLSQGKPEELKWWIEAVTSIKWIGIPGGSFMMGSNDGDPNEKPAHHVNLHTFHMSKSEVTVAQYTACVKAGVCSEPKTDNKSCNWKQADRQAHPINCVTWDQANTFAHWVGSQLPTEAQWEYAARSSGKDRMFPWGNQEATCRHAVMDPGQKVGQGCGKNSTWPVCSKRKGNTKQGVCDMAGNVWEWVRDSWQDNYNQAPTDGFNICNTSACKKSKRRVLRGGSWFGNAGLLRTRIRLSNSQSSYDDVLGFRLVSSSL